jgi:hypothetical protein
MSTEGSKQDLINQDDENSSANVREEFGTEITGGMNATKIYDVLLSHPSDKDEKKRR